MGKLKDTESKEEVKEVVKREETPVYKVLLVFRGKAENRNFYPGENVSHFDKKRLERLIARKIVEKV